MTEIDSIFEEQKRRMNAAIDQHCAELHASVKKSIDDTFNTFIKIAATVAISCFALAALLWWIGVKRG